MHASVKTKALSGSFRSLRRVFVTDAMHMKLFNQFILFSSLIPTGIAAQSFAPFEPGSRKLFGSTQGFTQAYEIAFDSTSMDGGITTYHNFKTTQDTLTPSTCGWWGAPECMRQDKPTWIGARIEKDDQGVHRFFTALGDTVTLHFSSALGSQTPIYEDQDQRFLLSYSGDLATDVLGLTENIRRWTIIHEDIDGQPINSSLNNAFVDVGESVGLARFFRVDSFPLVLEPVELLGQMEPPLGLYRITQASLHDYQPGDEIQKHHYAFHYTGPPTQNYNFFQTTRILSRQDTPENVTYEVELSTFNMGGANENVQSATLSYSKTEVITELPFTRFDGTQPLLGSEDHCGLPLLTYRTYFNQGFAYCPEENCWGPYDTNGPPPAGTTALVNGLGVYESSSFLISQTGFNMSSRIVFFIKNGVPCGTEAIVGIGEHTAANTSLLLVPNPAKERVEIIGLEDAIHAELFSASGMLVIDEALSNSNWLELGELKSGLYLMRVTTRAGVVRAGRLMIER
jgi:hypothetical protein